MGDSYRTYGTCKLRVKRVLPQLKGTQRHQGLYDWNARYYEAFCDGKKVGQSSSEAGAKRIATNVAVAQTP